MCGQSPSAAVEAASYHRQVVLLLERCFSCRCPPIVARALVSALLGLAGVLVSGCSASWAGRERPAAAPAISVGVSGRAEAVAPGVYMFAGTGGEPGPANLGRTGNAGFIVGPAGVLVVDTGVSFRHGEALLAEVARITPLPVRQVIVTHTRQEFLFGASAFRARGIPVHMHRRAAQLMAARCEGCLKTLVRVLGEDEMRGTAMFTPDAVFDTGWTTTVTGRPAQVLYLGHSSGPGDVAVFEPQSGVLFGGGLVDGGYIPDVQDSQLAEWAKALTQLQALPLRRVVPGHGPAASPALLGQVARYLAQLQQRTADLLAHGTALSEVADRTELPEFRDWDQYDTIHRRNASVIYLRLERESMFK